MTRSWRLLLLPVLIAACYRAADHGVDDPSRGALVVHNRSPFDVTRIEVYALPDSTLAAVDSAGRPNTVFPVPPGEYVVLVDYARTHGVLYVARGGEGDRVQVGAGQAVIFTLSGGDPTPSQPSLEFRPPSLTRKQSVKPAFWVLVGFFGLVAVLGAIAKVQEAMRR